MNHQPFPLNTRRKFRGGWSTSMNSLLDEPGRKSNCCALSCCGICLYDRTNFLVTGVRPNWRYRCFILFIPWILIVVIGTVSSMNQLACQDQYDATTDPTGFNNCQANNAGTIFLLEVAAFLCLLGICIRGGKQHGNLRVAVHEKMRAQRGDTSELSIREYSQIREPTCCCSCYQQDIVDSIMAGDVDTGTTAIIPDDDDLHRDGTPYSYPDLSTCLFKTWTNLCFGFLCNCWCMCCGMCAVGQEDRELELIYQRENNADALRIDYITFQPYSEYFPAIQMLQRSQDMSFQSHYAAMSLLSKRIVRWAFRVIVFTSLLYYMSPTAVDGSGTPMYNSSGGYKALVNLGVWIQPVLVLYFIWWKSNRFVISLDSIIKYFASGYIIGFFQALIVETLISIPFIMIGIVTFFTEMDGETTTNLNQMKREDVQGIIKEHMGVWALFVFFLSFGLAAFVEEIVKYYCYFTVETPDQLDTTTTTTGQNKSKVDQAKFVTIAMVSAALGFACKENMQYVFQSPNIRDEATTLLLRSLLAVHPVCAAIQAIGVVRRDVLGDSTSSLGWTLLPAIFLHGSFDFVAIVYALFLEDWGSLPDVNDMSTPTVTLDEAVKQGGIGLFFMIPGLAYFFWQYHKQQRQLDLDDSNNNFQMNSLHFAEEDEQMDNDSPKSPIIAV